MEMGQQRLVFEPAPPGYRKVIFSTNIAQTSITIPEMRLEDAVSRLLYVVGGRHSHMVKIYSRLWICEAKGI